MPSANYWNKGQKTRRVRKTRRVLILCEDEKSSRDYFATFPYKHDQIEIACVGTGMNTDSLMEDAISRKQKALKTGEPYERIWVVFDKDDFPALNFGRAFDLARSHREITACWSNECFELWYLLHFAYRDTGLSRQAIFKEVSKRIRRKYDKSDGALFEMLKPHQETALKNARRLAMENQRHADPHRNPSTGIHELVDFLSEFESDQQQ